MIKTINIYQNTKDLSDVLYNVNLDQIDSVPNYSINQILFKGINNIDNDSIQKVLLALCQKLALQGFCTIEILNMKSVCSSYLSGSITDINMYELLRDKINYVSLQTIKNIIEADNSLTIAGIDISQYTMSIKIERVKL